MDASLEEVAETADEVADEQREVADQARSMQRRRDEGDSWATIFEEQPPPGLLAKFRHSARLVTEGAGRASRLLASGLLGEGESRRQIARRFGVSHQRVSVLLNSSRRSGS